jgi:hypothetical protein
VVIPEEMEEAVQGEVGDLSAQRPPRRLCLHACGLDRNVDFPKKDGPLRIPELLGIGQREREYVGRPVDLPVVAVQNTDLTIAGQDDGEPGVRAAEPDQGIADE